jgi:hypothetical protein
MGMMTVLAINDRRQGRTGEEGLVDRPSCLQDRSGSSTGCWPVLPLQLTSGGSSSPCAPVGLSSARWNDQQNDRGSGCTSRRLPQRRGRPGRSMNRDAISRALDVVGGMSSLTPPWQLYHRLRPHVGRVRRRQYLSRSHRSRCQRQLSTRPRPQVANPHARSGGGTPAGLAVGFDLLIDLGGFQQT